MATYPPTGYNVAGETVTASRFLSQPNLVARRMRTLAELGYIGATILKGRQASVGGAVGFEQVEGIFADAGAEIVAPGAEYSLTPISDGPAGTARLVKWGKDSIVTDESIVRRNMDPVEKGLRKLANSAALAVDSSVLSVVASAVTQTGAAVAKWSTGPATILQDIQLAIAAISGAGLGYNPDTLLVSDTAWAYLASNQTIASMMSRETLNNTVYTGRFVNIAGLDVVHVPDSRMPGGAGTTAWLLDTNQLGFIATEDLGGNYQRAGDLIETKSMRVDENDAWRIRARANFAPVVTDPLAGYKLTGVL